MMKKSSSMVAACLTTALSLSALCYASVSFGAEPDAAILSFDFTDQKFAPEFVQWVADVGARKPFIITDEKKLSDIVAKECGQAAEPNLRLFGLVIRSPIMFENGATIFVPPCLPIVKATLQPRVVASYDRFWNYFRDGRSGLENVVFRDRPIETYSASNPPNSEDGTALPNDATKATTSQFNESAIYEEFTSQVAKGKNSVDGPSHYENAIANFWKRKSLNLDSKMLDIGQLAYDTAFMKDTLDRYGLNVSTDDIVNASLQPNMASNNIDRAEVVALAETATTRWSNADFAGSAELASQVAGSENFGEKDYLSNVKWFTPDAKQLKSKDPKTLQPGDLVVTPSVITQKIQIPVDKSLAAAVDGPGLRDIPAAFADSPAITMHLENLDTFNVDEIAPSQCKNAGSSRWERPSFIKMFREAAFRTRLRVAQDGRTSAIEAKVVIADSGFVSAEDEGPFASTLAIFGPSEERRQMPDASFSENQRTHGTAVTGLAIGGPQLWPLASALGIKLEVIPRRIFDARVVAGGKATPFFMGESLDSAARTSADVYNLSFGSRDKNAMDVFRGKYFGKSMNKLFVIAAGNNNLNDGDKGVDVGSVSIYPQFWAGNESGANVLLVAGLDGEELATFSNYSATRISLAAPGCSVGTWKPSDGDAKYDEKTVTGTSFSAPIVSYVAALVKALSPPDRSEATWVRARLISSADLTAIKTIEHGRVFNPVKAISLYDDAVELGGPTSPDKLLFGRLQWTGELNDVCDGVALPQGAVLLKLARDPDAATPLFHIYYLRDDTLDTSLTCTPRANAEFPLRLEDSTDEIIKIADVKDIVFRYN
ncbi:hypothetical protein ELI49_30230 (plasmid) [Rhizobium ruizarguesonis]|nr:hypothetical protein ELI49_30230 [Rhizobium ruizarguesonis]